MRKKTFWKYYLAQFCYDYGEYKLSFFILKEIDGFLLKNNLKYWESDLEKNVVYLLIQCLEHSTVIEFLKTDNSVEDEFKELSNSLYSRLCQLDPILALGV